MEAALAERGERAAGVNIHYLSTGLDVDVTLLASAPDVLESDAQRLAHLDLAELKSRLGVRHLSVLRAIALDEQPEAATPVRQDIA